MQKLKHRTLLRANQQESGREPGVLVSDTTYQSAYVYELKLLYHSAYVYNPQRCCQNYITHAEKLVQKEVLKVLVNSNIDQNESII